jgi:hypothetical protein
MLRTIKNLCTLNLLVSMVVFGGYVFHGVLARLDSNDQIFGAAPDHMGQTGSPLLWLLEFQIAALFIAQWLFKVPTPFHRRLCYILWGGLGLFFTLGAGAIVETPNIDHILGAYVWISNILFGFVGKYEPKAAESNLPLSPSPAAASTPPGNPPATGLRNPSVS